MSVPKQARLTRIRLATPVQSSEQKNSKNRKSKKGNSI